MGTPVFKTTLTPTEIANNFKDTDFFGEIAEGLGEALAHARGNPRPTTVIHTRVLPAVNVVAVRRSLNMTQRGFADILGVSPRTVEAWESGRTNPTPTAKKLIKLISDNHALVEKLR